MRSYSGLKGRGLHAAIWAESCVLVTIFGYNQAAAGGVLTHRSFRDQFPTIDVLDTPKSRREHKSTIEATVIAMYTLCGVFGSLACTLLGDKYGRRWILWISCLFNAVGALLMCTSFSLGQFVVARLVLGFGTGGIIATTSVWQSELSKASSRGSHVSAFGMFAGVGLTTALWIDYACSFVSNSFSWRFPLAVPMVYSAIAMSTIFALPESPRWLMKMGRVEEATAIMELLHSDPEIVRKELNDISVSLEISGNVRMSSLLKMGPQRVLHRVLIACAVQAMLQLTGVNSITYYESTLFEVQLRFSQKTAEMLSAASQLAVILGSFICSYTVDRFGRRVLMMTSASMMCICFGFMAGLVAHPNNKSGLDAAVFFVFFYEVCFTLGWLGLPFLYASEIAPAKQRAQICGLSTASTWLFNFVVAEITPVAFTNIGWKYFIVYCVLNALWVPVIYFFFPETKGRSLEEIDEIFLESKSIFDTVRISKRLPAKNLSDYRLGDAKRVSDTSAQPDGESTPPSKPEADHVDEQHEQEQSEQLVEVV